MKKEEIESFAELDQWLNDLLKDNEDRELAIAMQAQTWLADKDSFEKEIEQLTRWCIRAMTIRAGPSAALLKKKHSIPDWQGKPSKST